MKLPRARLHALPVEPLGGLSHEIFSLAYSESKLNRRGIVASFERHGGSRVPSFPRKRESSLSVEHFHRPAQWIPAFAGMTCASKCILCQMTPPPPDEG